MKKDNNRDEFSTNIYNNNGLGLYHPVNISNSVSDQFFQMQMQMAVYELATKGASAFRPWNPAGSCKHRER